MSTDEESDQIVPQEAGGYREKLPTSSSDIDEARETIEELNDAPRESGDPLIEQSDIVGNPVEPRNSD